MVAAGALLFASCAPQGVGTPESREWPVAKTGEFCGGMAGVRCETEGDFCKLPMSARCGAADAGGVCAPVPEICTQDYMPVCGCDARNYPNECAAHAAGVSAAYAGACTG